MKKDELEQVYALEVFSRLVLEDPSNIRYLTSQAATAYMMKDYSLASKIYLTLAFAEGTNLIAPLYYACKSLLLSQNIDKVRILFPFLKEKAKIDYTWNEKIRELEEFLHEYV
jgi:hypothetical protein